MIHPTSFSRMSLVPITLEDITDLHDEDTLSLGSPPLWRLRESGPRFDISRYSRGGLAHPPPRRFASTGETISEAAARLGICTGAIRQRLAYGWTEEQALSVPRRGHVRPQGWPTGRRHGARPGVKLMPLTPLETNTLQMLAEGFKPREILRKGEKLHALYVRLQRMRVKLDAFTTWHMIAIGLQRGIIHHNTGEIPNEVLRSYIDAH